MAIPVLVLGQSGTGKSYSMKNFNEDEICLISVQKALLPFRKKFNETVVTDKYTEIITKPSCTEQGYTKYTCSVCSYSYNADETAKLAHTPKNLPALLALVK